LRRWIITAAVLLGALALVVEGYYLYRFYAEPGVGSVRDSGRSASESETRPPDNARSGTETEPKAKTEPENKTRPENEARSEIDDARYLREVEELQAEAVEAFLDSHEKLRRYDGLTADDVEKMQENQDSLIELSSRVEMLDPPRAHREQYEVFRYAIFRLEEATAIAHELAADPVSATRSRFETYDRRTEEAATGLRRSNELLGRDYETVGDVQDIGA
jgi:hypothetical protein